MDFIKEKIRVIQQKLFDLCSKNVENLDYEYVECPEYKKSNIQPKSGYKKAADTQYFTGVDTHYWIHTIIKPLKEMKGCELRLSTKTGRENQWDACNPQIIAYMNGKNVQGIDINHRWLSLEYENEYDISLYLYTGTGLVQDDF